MIKDTTDTVMSASYLDLYFAMTFHPVLSTFLSSVATSLQHMGKEFSYHNSYVMSERVVTSQFFVSR